METAPAFDAVVYRAKFGPDSSDPRGCNPAGLFRPPVREVGAVVPGNALKGYRSHVGPDMRDPLDSFVGCPSPIWKAVKS